MFIVALVIASIQVFSSLATARYAIETLNITGTSISEPVYFGIVTTLTVLPTLLVWPGRAKIEYLTLYTDLTSAPLSLRSKLAFVAAPLTTSIGMLNQFGTLPNCLLLLIAAFVVYVLAYVSSFFDSTKRNSTYRTVPQAVPATAQIRKGGLLQ